MLSSIESHYGIILYVIDVLVVSYFIYRVLLVIRGTRAARMLEGLIIIVLIYFIAKYLDLITVSWLLGNFLSSIIIIIIVLFQDEIRRGLTKMGLQQSILGKFRKPMGSEDLDEIIHACNKLAKDRLGAIIAIQRDVGLDEFIESGVQLDANLDRKLLYSLFVKDSQLHDGAVVLERNKIRAAGCVLPLTFDMDIDQNLGTRHRAAIGLSERSDAIIIVVSEENGSISLVREGRIIRNIDASMLRDYLYRFIETEDYTEEVAQ